MSLLRNFFQFFRKNAVDEDFDYQENEYESLDPSATAKDSGKKKEVEARIAYQYPSGNFRFPLIPDVKVQQRRGQADLGNKVKQEYKKDDYSASEIGTASKNVPVKKRTVNKKEPGAGKTEGPAKMVRAFKPTEIPSPIYGFERPTRTKEIEYELTGFSPDTIDLIATENSGERTEEIQNPLENAIAARNIEKDILTEGSISSSVEDHPSNATAGDVFKEEVNPIQPFFVANGYEDDPEVAQSTTLLEKEDINNSSINGVSVDDHAQVFPIPDYQVTDKPVVKKEEAAYILNEKAVEPLIAFNEGASNLVAENDATLSEGKEQGEIQDSVSQKGNEEKNQSAVEKQQERPHLPFNVLMLKQDKKKLEKQLKPGVSENPHRLYRQPDQQGAISVPVEIEMNKSGSVEQQKINAELSGRRNQQQDSLTPAPNTLERTIRPTVDMGEAEYLFPGMSLLKPPVMSDDDPEWLAERTAMLDQTLQNFNVGARVVNVTQGPSVTRFEVHPEPGVKVNKVTNLSDDIKLSLAARDIRIEAPIPGKHTIGIEVPNPTSRPVLISEIIGSKEFTDSKSPLTTVLGLDISGRPIVTDLKKMPHGLIAGATGSGKSVCINSILVSLMYKAGPDDLKLLLIDPKMVELAPYNRIPHLVSPVITDVKAATAALKWAVEEMERRYELFVHAGVRDINRFNENALQTKRYSDKLPFIVIIIDELADLMMMSPADVEEAICRIAQKARACGIHLIVATQRPSVDVITGLIKANVPTRVAFSVSSQIDSRTIIDISGAEKLLGRGDMLFLENGSSKPVRLQGTFVSDEEIDKVVSHVREQRGPAYLFEQEELLKKAQVTEEEDELFYEACEFVIDQAGASTSSLQRRFKIGYNRAARLMDMMEVAGFISGSRGSRPRDVLITEAELDSIQEANPAGH